MTPHAPATPPLRADVGFASWPALGEKRSGDRLLLERSEQALTLLLVDVAGHGDAAAHIADALVLPPPTGPSRHPADLLAALDVHLRGSVGAAAGALVIDLEGATWSFASIGSVQLHHSQAGFLPGQAGHLGVTQTRIRERRGRLAARDTLVLFSDGVRLRGLREALGGLRGSAHQKAGALLHLQSRTHDDGTVAWIDVELASHPRASMPPPPGVPCPS